MSLPAAYLAIILIWSTTPLAIQWSTQGAGFAFAVLLRMAIGLLVDDAIVVVENVERNIEEGRTPLDRKSVV